MSNLYAELLASIPDATQLAQILLRLFVATLLGAVVGAQREHTGKAAGLRTHMLVSLGGAVLVLAAEGVGMDAEAVSRIIQGLAAGIGFLGAGAILKLSQEREIRGLTTAAGIWLTSAIGIAAGMGQLGVAVIGTAFAWLVLSPLGSLERRLENREPGAK